MRIDLGKLAAQDLQLELPAGPPDRAARDVTISNAEALRGVFETRDAGFELTNLSAERLLLAKLHWQFGSLRLVSEEDAALTDLAGSVVSTPDDLDLRLGLGQLHVERLQLATPKVHVTGQVEARGVRLESREGVGLLTADRAVMHGFEFQMGPLVLQAPELIVTQLVVDWGSDDFKLEAGTADAAALTVTRDGVHLDGAAVALAAFALLGGQIRVGQLRAGRFDVRADLAASTRGSEAPSSSPVKTGASFDYALLDALSGRLDVDVHVDVALPIIGGRKAVHPLRVPIDRGALNYRELEHNLAPLEDSLLDFAVRDGGLVLEVGIPLLQTRGRGKPLLVWDLSPRDLALAEEQRVRLAVLPGFHTASNGQSEAPTPDSTEKNQEKSAIKLRHLSFENIDAALRLLSGPSDALGVLRDLTFANLTLRGDVHHDPEGTQEAGAVELGIEGVRATLGDLVLGDQHLKGRIELATLRGGRVEFQDVRPVFAKAALEGVAIADLQLAQRVTSSTARPS